MTPGTEPGPTTPPETASHLEQMAHQLAAHHVIGPQAAVHGRYLAQLPRLEQQLQEAHQQFVHASTQDLALSGASEWLLDNYYLVVEALRQIERICPTAIPGSCRGSRRLFPRRISTSRTAAIYAVAYAFDAEEHC